MRTLLSLTLALCSLVPKSPAQTQVLDTGWIEGISTQSAGGTRHAILVGVGKHQSRPAWDLAFIEHDLRAVEEVLRDSLKFHRIEVIQDSEVSTARINTAIEQARGELSGKGNLLLIYWAGHGWVNAKNELRFLTSFSTYSESKGYRYTIGEGELARMLSPFSPEDSGVTVVSVFDCCRVKTLGPTGRRPKEVTAGKARIYSTKPGTFAFPSENQSRSRFSEAFESAARDLASDVVLELGDLFDTIKSRMGPEQTPELRGERGSRNIRVYDRGNLSLGIDVVDALSGKVIQNAAIKIADKQVESPATLSGLTEGDYRLDVRTPGYMRALVSDISLSSSFSGRRYRVALKPSYAVISGSIADSEGQAVEGAEVRLSGSRGRSRDGYHRFKDYTDSSGAFEFRVPKDAGLSAVSVKAGEVPVQSRELDLAAMKPREDLVGGELVRTYELGAILLPPDVIIAGALGLSELNLTVWEQAERFLSEGKREDLDVAIGYYKSVRVDSNDADAVDKRIRACYVQMLSHYMSSGEYKVGQRIAEMAISDFPGDVELAARLEKFKREDIPSDLRGLLDEASEHLVKNEDAQAERLYRKLLSEGARLTEHYVNQVTLVQGKLNQQLFADAFVQINTSYLGGDFAVAAEHYRIASELRPDDRLLALWKDKLRTRGRRDFVNAPSVEGFSYVSKNPNTGLYEYRHDQTGLEFVLILGGTFMMGSPQGVVGRDNDELQHEVTLSPYLIAKY